MNIETVKQDACITLKLNGRLDTITAPAVEATLMERISECNALVLDFAGVEYISSAGLRVILKSQKLMAKKGGMKLVHVSETIMEIFEITGFADILTIE